MRLLVIGANGLLGSNVVRASRQRGWDVTGTYHSTPPEFTVPLTQFDLREYGQFEDVLDEHDPDVVVNCAAMTDVDGCEANPDAAYEINGKAPGEIAARCSDAGIPFVHVSTDYVFDGEARDPYTESDATNPRQAYGKSKLAGERAVFAASDDALVLRLSFVWGIHRSSETLTGFPSWVRERLQSGESVPLFTDQWVTPTRAGQAADTLLELVERDETGRYHVACSSCVTPHEFGEALVEFSGADADLLRRGSVADVDRAATRPTYSCLDVSRVEDVLGRPQPTLRADLEAIWDAVG